MSYNKFGDEPAARDNNYPQHRSQVVLVQPAPINNQNENALELPPRPRPSPGKWADGICDWSSNLFPSCYCACCCCYGMWIMGQMAEKTNYGKFSYAIGGWVLVMFLSLILNIVADSNVFMLFPFFYALIYSIMLRMHIIKSKQITDCSSNIGMAQFLDGCCCGFFCFSCSVCQMARYVYGYNKVLDGDSAVNRPDNYELVTHHFLEQEQQQQPYASGHPVPVANVYANSAV